MKVFHKILITIIAVIIIAVVSCLLIVNKLLGPAQKEASEVISMNIKVPSGSTAASVGRQLESNGLIISSDAFYYYAKFKKSNIKSGIYKINSGMSISEIIDVLESGMQEFISLSIPEGYTLRQMAVMLEENDVIASADDFISMCHNQELLDKYEIPGNSFEGYLFPDTYYFDPESASENVICMMADNFFAKLSTIPEFAEKTPQDIFYYVRLASIIEREYRVADEAPLISSVFTNRLNTKQNGHTMGLYSCATVVYIITDILGKPHPSVVTKADTQIDNPYNTYKYEGLPPGAISNPGLIALNAAINPAKTNYKYFRVIDEQAGRHAFSENLEEHNTVGTYSVKK